MRQFLVVDSMLQMLTNTELTLGLGLHTQTFQGQMYLQLHYGNGIFGNVYLSAGQHLEVNIASTPLS